MKKKTAHTEYGEPDDEIGKHWVCNKCSYCKTCGDCEKFGCGSVLSAYGKQEKKDE